MIVGARQDGNDATGGNPLNVVGSAYVFERDGGGTWSEVQKIVASDRSAHDYFGWSVSLSGNRVLIGAESDDEGLPGSSSLSAAGSAYLFERNGNRVWSEGQKIVAMDRAVDDYFGYSVSLSGDNVLVGAMEKIGKTTARPLPIILLGQRICSEPVLRITR